MISSIKPSHLFARVFHHEKPRFRAIKPTKKATFGGTTCTTGATEFWVTGETGEGNPGFGGRMPAWVCGGEDDHLMYDDVHSLKS